MSLPARSKRTQLGNILGVLAKAKPAGPTDVAGNLRRIAAMIRHRSLLMLFSDLLCEARAGPGQPAPVAARRA